MRRSSSRKTTPAVMPRPGAPRRKLVLHPPPELLLSSDGGLDHPQGAAASNWPARCSPPASAAAVTLVSAPVRRAVTVTNTRRPPATREYLSRSRCVLCSPSTASLMRENIEPNRNEESLHAVKRPTSPGRSNTFRVYAREFVP